MAGKNNFVSFRIDDEAFNKLNAIAKNSGLSPSGCAREILLEKLIQSESEKRGWVELFAEMDKMRRDLASSTKVILSVCSNDVNAREKADSWVRKNLLR